MMDTKVEGPGGSELIDSVRPVAWIKRTPSGTYLRTAEVMEDIPESEDWLARGGWEPLCDKAARDAAVAAERGRWRDAINALADEWDDPAEAYGMRLALNEGLKA